MRRPVLSSYVEATVEYPNYSFLSVEQELPTSEPTDPQVTITYDQSLFPIIKNIKFQSILGFGAIRAHNPTSSTVTIYLRIYYNGELWKGSYRNVSANWYVTATWNKWNINPGDEFGIKMWANTSGVIWNSVVWYTSPTRGYFPEYMGKIVFNFKFEGKRYPVIAEYGNAGGTTGYKCRIKRTWGEYVAGTSSSWAYGKFTTDYFYRLEGGDYYLANALSWTNHQDDTIYHLSNIVLTKVRFYALTREILL